MQQYDVMITLKKAFIAAAPGVVLGAASGALGVLQGGNQTVTMTAIGVGALTGALIGLKNYLSNAR